MATSKITIEVAPIDVPATLRRNARALLDAADRLDGGEPREMTAGEFLDSMPVGLHLKCAGCRRFTTTDNITFVNDGYLCGRCS